MILFLKHAAITIFVLIGFLAALIAPVAWISQNMSDNPNDDSGRLMTLFSLCALIVCILSVMLLSGCSTVKPLIDACREGLCR